MGEIFQPDAVFREWLEAAERGDTAFVIAPAPTRIDVNSGHDGTSTTALMMAVRGCRTEMVRLLLDRGADPGLENCLGCTAMTYGVISSRSWGDYWHVPRPDPRPLELLLAAGGRYRLREAVLLNDVELARARLDEGADVDTGEGTYHGPLLKIAAELGYLEIVDLLLDRGADIEATDDLGQRGLLSTRAFRPDGGCAPPPRSRCEHQRSRLVRSEAPCRIPQWKVIPSRSICCCRAVLRGESSMRSRLQ